MAKTKNGTNETESDVKSSVMMTDPEIAMRNMRQWFQDAHPEVIDDADSDEKAVGLVCDLFESQHTEIGCLHDETKTSLAEINTLRGRDEELTDENARLTKMLKETQARLQDEAQAYGTLIEIENPKAAIARVVETICLSVDPTINTFDISTPLPEGDELWETCMARFGINKPTVGMTDCRTFGDLNTWAYKLLTSSIGEPVVIRGSNSPADKQKALLAVRKLGGITLGRSATLREAVLSNDPEIVKDEKVVEALQFCNAMDQTSAQIVEAFLNNK